VVRRKFVVRRDCRFGKQRSRNIDPRFVALGTGGDMPENEGQPELRLSVKCQSRLTTKLDHETFKRIRTSFMVNQRYTRYLIPVSSTHVLT